jgi:signal transduction histidine kinase/ActR/RegA family two-component response regulator
MLASRAMRLRSGLFLLVLATAIPLAGFSLLLSGLLLKHQYENFIAVVKDRNRAFMTAVEAEVNGHISSLQAVASSRALAAGDLHRFHEEAVGVLASQSGWLNLILLAPDGQHLVNALVPWGTPLRNNAQQPDSLRPVLETLKPSIGHVVPGGDYQPVPGFPMRVPVLVDGKVAYVLTAIVKPESFNPLFAAQRLPAGWTSGLVDASGGMIARIPPRPPGTRASPDYLRALDENEEGWYRGRTLDGVDTYTSFNKSKTLGWSLGFAIPAEQVHGSYRNGAWIAGGGLLIVLGLALGIAFWLSRRLARPMAELSSAAASLGQDGAPIDTRSGVHEVVELERALNDASAAILARDSELRRQASELQAADANKSQFLALLSHELRNPLAPLSNGLAVLKMRGDAQAVARTHAMMERQIGQLRRLIDDLLDVSRIDRGKFDLRKERVAIDAVVRNAIETAKPNIEAKHHALAVRYAREALYVDGDAVRLCQVVSNLLNNAAKFTPAHGRIEVATRAEAGRAVIAVADSGIGFTAEDRTRIFDMFVQLDASRTQTGGGLGLGLTLVRSLVEMHGGTIEAESAGPGQGATFTVGLPLAEAPAAAHEIAAPLLARPARGRVMVVDDNVDAADSLADILGMEGFEVRACYAGDEALSLARQFRPEVVFLDLNMPGMSGIELAAALRAEAGGSPARLIALTGMGQKTDIDATRAAGFAAHLTKPAPAAEVIRLASAIDATVIPFGTERRA